MRVHTCVITHARTVSHTVCTHITESSHWKPKISRSDGGGSTVGKMTKTERKRECVCVCVGGDLDEEDEPPAAGRFGMDMTEQG